MVQVAWAVVSEVEEQETRLLVQRPTSEVG